MSNSTDSRNARSQEAPAEERASPLVPPGANDPAIPAEPNEAFWAGVRHGIAELQRRAVHPHLPSAVDEDLTRSSAAPSLTSAHLSEAFDAAPPPPEGSRAARHDGWPPQKERLFCE